MRLLVTILVIAALTYRIYVGLHPDLYQTRLPVGTTDLTSIQPQLNKLPPTDRQLVIDYLQRSQGQVVPVELAHPDEPFTARTFAAAIDLQRQFLVQEKAAAARANERKEAMDENYAPLRAALSVELINREILPRSQFVERASAILRPDGRIARQAVDTREVPVTTFRITNRSNYRIESFKANVTIRKAHPTPLEIGVINTCYITYDIALEPLTTVDFPCTNVNTAPTRDQRAFMDMPDSDFDVIWEPVFIHFAEGQDLKYQSPF